MDMIIAIRPSTTGVPADAGFACVAPALRG
jgi:hypothetical protein